MQQTKEVKVQRNQKDTIFRMLFREKENLLSLYNAMNKTAYANTEDLEITTLENAVYMNYSKRHNKFLFPALAEAIYGSCCKAENEISNVVNYIKTMFPSCLTFS